MLCFSRAFAALALTFVSGCGHAVEVAPKDVTGVARYSSGERVTLMDRGAAVAVTEERSPDLVLHLARSCSVGELLTNTCDRVVTAPLERVRFDGRALRLQARAAILVPTYRDVVAEPSEIESAQVLLHGYDPPAWRPTWGVGFTIAGAAGAASPDVEWLPARWLGLEAGLLPAADAGDMFVAMRVRPLSLGPLRPFLGWFLNYAYGIDVGATSSSANHTAGFGGVGPRLGVDVEIARGHVFLRAEGDLAHPLTRDRLYFGDEHGRWVPWGGGGVAYYF